MAPGKSPDGAERIPLRALNQATYCERLYFLEYVDAVMPTNEHVEAGLFEHRRVADRQLAHRPRKEGNTMKTRSVSLASDRLGLTGVLDLLEECGDDIVPVETKKSSAPRDADGKLTVWDNDAAQLCGQALLLEEEFQKPVPRGVVYYAGSKERIEVPIDPPLRQKTLDLIERIRVLGGRDTAPDPLPNSLRHRCFGCSLAPICLPEETLFALDANGAAADSSAVTRVIPQSDDGAVLYVQEPGAHVGKRSEHLVIKKDGRELSKVPIAQIRQVVIFGNVQVSTQALETLVTLEIPVVYLTGYGRFIASMQPAPKKNVRLREEQFRRFADPVESLKLSTAVVRAKLTNQRALLMRSLRDDDARGSDEPAARDMAELLHRLDSAKDISTVLGLEGQGAALYFGEFARFLRAEPPGRGFDFKARNRRPPRDPVNALLSFAYALLAKDCFAALCTVGFDPYRGFFHTGRHGRPSLALDLMEEFRAIIADSVVLTLINNRQVTPGDFLTWREAVQLTDTGRQQFFRAYEQRMSTVVTHPVFSYKMSYARMLEVQARMLAAYVKGELPQYIGFVVR